MFSNKHRIGEIHTRKNAFHTKCVYLDFEFDQYNKEEAQSLFQTLILEIKRSLQVMTPSVDLQKINYIKEADFMCKRKCFGMC